MKKFFYLVLLLILNSCGSDRDSKADSEAKSLEVGFKLVDEQRYDEALDYFSHLYEAGPTDDALKAWASVLVARSGLKVTDLYKVFVSFPKTEVNETNVWSQIQLYQKSLDQIPNVKGDDRQDVLAATEILQQRNSPSVRLFRGLLNLVLLRSTFSDGESLLKATRTMKLDQNVEGLCKGPWKPVRNWLQTWTYYGLELKKDLAFAKPLQNKDWEKGAQLFSHARTASVHLTRACNK